MKKEINPKLLIVLILIAVTLLSYASYKLGYKTRDVEYDQYTMMLWLDSSTVRTGIYDFLPNNQHRILQYNFENEGSETPEIKIIGEIKYFKVGDTIYDINDEDVWKYLSNDKVFKGQEDMIQPKRQIKPKKKEAKKHELFAFNKLGNSVSANRN